MNGSRLNIERFLTSYQVNIIHVSFGNSRTPFPTKSESALFELLVCSAYVKGGI